MLLDGTKNVVGYARVLVDRGDGRTFLKPPRAIGPTENMAEYLLCERGFVPTITLVVEREMAQRVRYHPKLRAAEDTDFAIRLALEGCRFRDAPEPGAVWNDLADPGRASADNRADRIRRLAGEMRPYLTASAWHGGRGWAYAKLLAHNGRKAYAAWLYLNAVFRGCYRPLFGGGDLPADLPGVEALSCIGRCRHWLAAPGPQAQIAFQQIPRTCMMTRRKALSLGAAFAAFPARAEDVSLRALAAGKGILFGSAAANYELTRCGFHRLAAPRSRHSGSRI